LNRDGTGLTHAPNDSKIFGPKGDSDMIKRQGAPKDAAQTAAPNLPPTKSTTTDQPTKKSLVERLPKRPLGLKQGN
jgi:hypothetical protein